MILHCTQDVNKCRRLCQCSPEILLRVYRILYWTTYFPVARESEIERQDAVRQLRARARDPPGLIRLEAPVFTVIFLKRAVRIARRGGCMRGLFRGAWRIFFVRGTLMDERKKMRARAALRNFSKRQCNFIVGKSLCIWECIDKMKRVDKKAFSNGEILFLNQDATSLRKKVLHSTNEQIKQS